MEKKNFISREIYEVNGRKTFLKIKANAFGIGKVLFSFVEFDEASKKLKNSVDAYMKIGDMLVFSNDVLSGRLVSLAKKSKEKNPNFPPSVVVKQGGLSPEKAKREDGKALARVIKFGASSKDGSFLFQGESGAGKQDERGLIQLENPSKPEIRINVMCSADDLKALCLSFQAEYTAYLSGAYANGEFNHNAST